jgi:general secretion pathway protein M
MIKNLMQKLPLPQWRSLTPRDQLLYLGVAAGVLLMLYLSLWLPVQRELSRLRTAVPQEKVQLTQMQAQAMVVNQLRASGRRPMAGGNLLANLEQSATQNGIRGHITRMEPDGTNGARLSIDGANFNTLVTWLDQLQKQSGVAIEKATFDAQAAAGMVNARLVLRGSGA